MNETQIFALKLFVNSKRQSETVIPMAVTQDNAKSDSASPRVEETDSTNTAPQAASKLDTPLLHLNI